MFGRRLEYSAAGRLSCDSHVVWNIMLSISDAKRNEELRGKMAVEQEMTEAGMHHRKPGMLLNAVGEGITDSVGEEVSLCLVMSPCSLQCSPPASNRNCISIR